MMMEKTRIRSFVDAHKLKVKRVQVNGYKQIYDRDTSRKALADYRHDTVSRNSKNDVHNCIRGGANPNCQLRQIAAWKFYCTNDTNARVEVKGNGAGAQPALFCFAVFVLSSQEKISRLDARNRASGFGYRPF